MQVIYTDPDGRNGTYHPLLGYLMSGEPFDLEDEIANKYIESGLLEKCGKRKRQQTNRQQTDNRQQTNRQTTDERQTTDSLKVCQSESLPV